VENGLDLMDGISVTALENQEVAHGSGAKVKDGISVIAMENREVGSHFTHGSGVKSSAENLSSEILQL
jgi:hypothetical protein